MSKTHNTSDLFDLHDYVSKIHDVYVAAQIAQSTAWRIDTLIVSEARAIFRGVRDDLYSQGVDGYAELTAALHEAEFAEASFRETGKALEGSIEKLRALNSQRDQWHDLAAEFTSMTSDYQGAPRVYERPDLEEAFHRETSLKVGENTQRRLRVSASRMAEAYDMADQAEALFQRKMDRQKTQLGRIAESMKSQAGAVSLMFQLALRDDESSAAERSKDFADLPVDCRRVLLNNAVQAAERADERAASERGMSDAEYDRISLSALKSVRDINVALRAPALRVVANAEAAAAVNVG